MRIAKARSAGIIVGRSYSRAGTPVPPFKARRMTVEPTESLVAHVVALRRAIHRRPELGFEEHETAALVEQELSALGIEHRRLATTGVVGIVRGALPGRVVALRADMDALPITERTGLEF